MSWIFGAIDGAGVEADAVLDAAGRPLGPREPVVVASPAGTAVFGAFFSPGTSPGVGLMGGHLVAADARVDAVGDLDLGSIEAADAAAALADVLARSGPPGLDDVAADFALAWFDEQDGALVLTRDATGNRPLFWARREGRVAFASDPWFLVRLGMCTGDIDTDVCATALAGLDIDPRQSGLAGIHRVLGGRWIEVDPHGRGRGGRWFRPELDAVDDEIGEDSIAGLAAAIGMAVRDRARGGSVGLFLSGGRDSGALAVALQRQGVVADCFTMTFDPGICVSEDEPARAIALGTGHRWHGVLQDHSIVDDDMRWLLDRVSSPLGMPFATAARANHEAARGAGARVLMEGFGGELFVSSPLAVLDLVRALHLPTALRAARASHHLWVHPYSIQAKVALRATLPASIVSLRDRSRPMPPWAARVRSAGIADPMAARTAREQRLRFLLWEGTNPVREQEDASSHPDGIRTTYPFYDRRVIRAALRMPATALIPDPEPKWVLTEALLGQWSRTRVKGDQEAWFRAVARKGWSSHPDAYSERSLLAARGLVRPAGALPPFSPRWEVPSSALVHTEFFLQDRPSRPDRTDGTTESR